MGSEFSINQQQVPKKDMIQNPKGYTKIKTHPYLEKRFEMGLRLWAVLDSNQRPLRCQRNALTS